MILNNTLDENSNMYQDIYELSQEENNCKIRPDKLKIFELEIFRNEINKPMDERDLEKIDLLLIKLKFFQKLEKKLRINIIKHSQHIHFPKGTTIFNQGDYGDLMYIIIKGSVDVRFNHTFKQSNKTLAISTISLYDGYHFGELAMLGIKATKNPLDDQLQSSAKIPLDLSRQKIISGIGLNSSSTKIEGENLLINEKESIPKKSINDDVIYAEKKTRSATIQTAVETDVLALSREKFQEIMLSILQEDIDQKVFILSRIPFFKVMFLILNK